MSSSSGSVDNYKLISVIGKGTYAKVVLVRSKLDNKVYAMKILKKKYIMQKDQKNHIMTQKQILANLQHPFLVKLKCSFQDSKKLYFVMEYCPGGQLFGLLELKDKLTEQQTKFYSAQIVLAIEGLHQNGIVYRDLKPENVLMDRFGYLKVTDFGLSKLLINNNDLTTSVCGTPEYLAPQIILKKGHSFAVDWWCLGCIIYQMVTGFPPYHNQNRNKLFQSILYNPIQVPNVSPKLQNLLLKLLVKNPEERLGFNGVQEIKKHSWYEKVNWEYLTTKSIKAPFVPILSSEDDISNFSEQFTNCSLHSYSENTVDMGTPINPNQFFGFSYEA